MMARIYSPIPMVEDGMFPWKPAWELPELNYIHLYVYGTADDWRGQYLWVWVYSKDGKFILGGSDDGRDMIHFNYYSDFEKRVL